MLDWEPQHKNKPQFFFYKAAKKTCWSQMKYQQPTTVHTKPIINAMYFVRVEWRSIWHCLLHI